MKVQLEFELPDKEHRLYGHIKSDIEFLIIQNLDVKRESIKWSEKDD